jgi:hypothetical protein
MDLPPISAAGQEVKSPFPKNRRQRDPADPVALGPRNDKPAPG